MQTVIYCLKKKSFRDKNDFIKTTYLISIVKFSLVQYSYSIHGYRYTQCRYKECLNTEVSIPSYICHKKQSNYTHHAIVYTCVTYQDMKHILNLIAMEYIHEDWWKEIFCNALQNIYKFTVQKLNNESIVWWKMNENVCFFAFAFTSVHWIMPYLQNNCIGYFMKNALTWSISLQFF